MRISDWSSDVCSSDLSEQRAIVFFEAPHRLADCMADAVAVIGPDRRAAICRELTKTYEEVVRGQIGSASCRESVCQYVYISVCAVAFKKKNSNSLSHRETYQS